MRGGRYLTTGAVALHCNVDRRTVARWLDSGLLAGHTTGGGQRRVQQEDLLVFMAAHRMPLPAALAEPTKVAIVDDDAPFVRVLQRAVKSVLPAAVCHVARDGFEAGLLVAAHRPHIVLLDVFMPGLSGIDVCKRIRGTLELAATTIVAMTAGVTDEVQAQLTDAGANNLLDKGSLRPKLDELLKRAASPERHSGLPPLR